MFCAIYSIIWTVWMDMCAIADVCTNSEKNAQASEKGCNISKLSFEKIIRNVCECITFVCVADCIVTTKLHISLTLFLFPGGDTSSMSSRVCNSLFTLFYSRCICFHSTLQREFICTPIREKSDLVYSSFRRAYLSGTPSAQTMKSREIM